MNREWADYLFASDSSFEEKARAVFEYQFKENPVYQRFCRALAVSPEKLASADEIPLLPIRAFKDAVVRANGREPDLVFRSSGTSGMERSEHQVADADVYRRSILQGINTFYSLDELVIWAYTPGYSDNPDSSLVWMLNELIREDDSGLSRFLPLDQSLDEKAVEQVKKSGRRLMLFGAAFGLIDLVERQPVKLPKGSLVMETGGMKTHRREMSREELHRRLARGFSLPKQQVHSEYGMAEMLSQAYATGGAWFHPVPWLRVIVIDPDDPRRRLPAGREGLIGILDLANVHSCSFLLTGDRGVQRSDGSFKVLGRWKPDNLRGCNFLIDRD